MTCSTTTNGRCWAVVRCSPAGSTWPPPLPSARDGLDEYAVLDLLDSLVRKSLVTAEQVGGHARYGMLETIRQFAEEQLAATGTIDEVRDRHARYFAEQAVAHWDIWDGPRQRVAVDWVDVEFANLRAGFRWAADHGDLVTAAAIAAHTTMLGYALQRFEPVGWADEILDAATAADLPSTPPPLHRRQHLLATPGARGRRRLRPDRGRVGGRSPLRPVRARLEQQCWRPAPTCYAGGSTARWRSAPASPRSPGSPTSLGLVRDCRRAAGRRAGRGGRAIAEEAVTAARAHGNPVLDRLRAHRVRAGLRRHRPRPSPGRLS